MPSAKEAVLLAWSRHVPSESAQDPLGLNLRGLTRIASQLLFCITSITPRARYYSILPWCVYDWQLREQDQPHATGLRDGITLRERGLVLSCVAHHQGQPCVGGALVGTSEAQKWYGTGNTTADLDTLSLTQTPAFDAYFNSLVNLGFFKTDQERSVSADDEPESSPLTFDDLELTPFGIKIAEGYDAVVGALPVIEALSKPPRRVALGALRTWGEYGGLCELSRPDAVDRKTLIDVFFARVPLPGESHRLRRKSLLLLLELSRKTSQARVGLDEPRFQSATYYGEFSSDDEKRIDFSVPTQLQDISMRWRMFYFHHYMGVALEGLFGWISTNAFDRGLRGITFAEAVGRLSEPSVATVVDKLFGRTLEKPFSESLPIDLLQSISGSREIDPESAEQLDRECRPDTLFSEERIEERIRSMEHLRSAVGLALPMLLLVVTLARYARWEGSLFGNWLANSAVDPRVDLVPPVLTRDMRLRFGAWWKTSWSELTDYVLHRYVVRQHQAMAYEKTAAGDRCILETDNSRIYSHNEYRWINLGNPRFRSAVRILKDVAFLRELDGVGSVLTPEGERFLDAELLLEQNP